MRFDAYKASLPVGTDAAQIIDQLALDNPDGDLVGAKKRLGYEQCIRLRDGDGDRFADVLFGGANGVLIETSGDGTPAVVDLIRHHWPQHAVTRADVCQDIFEEVPGVFGRLEPQLDRLVTSHGRVKGCGLTPKRSPDDGATYTIGSRSSETYFRIYQKPEQLLAEGLGDRSLRVFFDKWVRVELEAKPQRDNRLLAAAFGPHEFFGLSRIARSVCDNILGVEVGRTSAIQYNALKTKARQRRVCLTQWGNMFREWKDDAGSWAEVGIGMRELLAQLEREKGL